MLRIVILASVIGLAGTAAQAQTPPELAACKPDWQRLCGDVQPGEGRVLACLKQHNDKLSDACKKVVEGK